MNIKKKAVLITGPGFEDPEVTVPLATLPEAGISVDVATVGKNPQVDIEVVGKHGSRVKPTVAVADLSIATYDAVIIPGGLEAPDRMRQNKEVLGFVRQMFHAGKLVSSTCHGPWVLISAGIVKGKKATCYVGMKDDLINAGAMYEALPAITDGNIITSDHPRNIAAWMKETVSWLQKN